MMVILSSPDIDFHTLAKILVMAKKVRITVGTEHGDVAVEVDPSVVGSLAHGAFTDLEALCDKDGHLCNSKDLDTAEGLKKVGLVLENASEEAAKSKSS